MSSWRKENKGDKNKIKVITERSYKDLQRLDKTS